MKGFQRRGVFWAGVLAVGLALPAQAALQSRLGGQAYYDTVLDITWLADANLAASKTFGVGGINAIGTMTWTTAQSWITALNADGGTGYLGYSDWRLPLIVDTGTAGCNSVTGTDCGYNVQTGSAATTVYSEMASLYYDTLGNLAYLDTSGSAEPQPGWGLTHLGPFENFQASVYWSGTEYAPNPAAAAWDFHFADGAQSASTKGGPLFAWAVRSGDVAVPEPASLGLVGTVAGGLLGVGWRRRRR